MAGPATSAGLAILDGTRLLVDDGCVRVDAVPESAEIAEQLIADAVATHGRPDSLRATGAPR